MKSRPWGVHTISDIFHPDCEAGMPDGSYVKAVAVPYTAGRLKAAWWVLTGRAYALLWPKAGDLERAIGQKPRQRKPWPHDQQKIDPPLTRTYGL